MLVKNELVLVGCGLGVLLLAGWFVKNNAAAVGAGAAKVVGDVAGGAVQEVGTWFGLPKTDETECQKALREGRSWDASLLCPAGTYVGSIFSHGGYGNWGDNSEELQVY